MRTILKMSRRVAPNAYAPSIKEGSVLRIPAVVLMITGKIARSTTTAIFEVIPMPKITMNSGAKAMTGVEYSADTHGWKIP
jgi:hypothetical protein